MSTQSSIQVGVANGLVHIRVEGKGSFQNSASLKDFAKEMLARGHREFVVDLAACPLMDSTFMGTLAGIALKLKGCGELGSIHIVNLNERNQGLLCNLGLDQLLRVECTDFSGAASVLPTAFLPTAESDKLAQAQTMLEAHEAVVTAKWDLPLPPASAAAAAPRPTYYCTTSPLGSECSSRPDCGGGGSLC